MNVNEYGQVSFTRQEVIESIYSNNDSVLSYVDDLEEIALYNQHCTTFDIPNITTQQKTQQDLLEFHQQHSSNWHMPQNYKDIDIEEFLTNKLVELKLTDQEYITTLADELNEYQQRNMLDLLRFLKYLMDVCSERDIVTGVGRGSSVASLVLYLLGVHAIDPIKYSLDYKEFLR